MKPISINNRRYMGSKYKILDFISEVIKKEEIKYSSFLDLFAGTGVVGNHFNDGNTKVYVNDLLKSNYISYLAWFGNEIVNQNKINNYLKSYNSLVNLDDNYFSYNFSNTYFSHDNCKKIGYIREDIEKEFLKGLINNRERAILITSLIYAMDKIANTVGHYDAYRRDGNLNKNLKLQSLNLKSNYINRYNQIYNEDANDLVRRISVDITYIDPPYNSRQYSDAYHLLENVVNWDKNKVFGVAKKMERKDIKSKYCSVSAPLVFKELIEKIDSKYIIVSYNNMGEKGASRSNAKISDEVILSTLREKGKVTVYEKDFQQFNSGKTKINNHKERLFVCKVGETDRSKLKEVVKIKDKVKSPLNYTGGKYRILDQLIPLFPSKIGIFIDLFSGGSNVSVNINAKEIICVDNQKEIIRIMKLLKRYDETYIVNKLESIIALYQLSNSLLNGYKFYNCTSDKGLGNYNKDKYLKLRNDYNNLKRDCLEKDLLFLVLIIYSFNNQVRFNNQGEFNMPVGKRDFNNSLRKNLVNFILKLKELKIDFICSDFRDYLIKTNNNLLVYCDPPYFLGLASYNENGGWTEEDEKDLLEYLTLLNKRGIKFALSNVIEHKGLKHPLLEEWARKGNYKIHYLNCNYNNSNYQKNGKKKYQTKEVLITNY